MPRLTRVLSLLLIGAATPALAQATLTLESSGTPSAGLSMSAPPSLEVQVEQIESSSSELSKMTAPPDLSSEDGGEDVQEDATDIDAGPSVSSRDALSDFFAACNAAASGVVGSIGQLQDAGWIANDTPAAGPFNTIYSGYRDFGGLGEVDVWGALQVFPTQRLGYCRVDFSDQNGIIDFNDMTGLGQLAGKVEDRGQDGVYGAWESPDRHVLVLADRVDGTVEIEFNFLLGDAPKS